jgi:hypothetical protein
VKRWVSPPNWPAPTEGFLPPAGWQPDPSWPQPPQGWQFWQRASLTTQARLTAAIAVVGAALCLIGSCLTWVTVIDRPDRTHRFVLQRIRGIGYTQLGPHIGPGIASGGLVTAGLAVVTLAVCAAYLASRSGTRLAAATYVGLGGLALAIVVRDVVDLNRTRGDAISFRAAGGLWLVLAGASLVIVSGLSQALTSNHVRSG